MRLLSPFFLLMILSIPFGPAEAAEAVTIGKTLFPLGDNAFPSDAQCLDPAGCGNEDYMVRDSTDRLFRPVPAAKTLLGHRLNLVAIDLDDLDVIRLAFPEPIANREGKDIYVGQARFFGDLADSDGINNIEIRFGDPVTWHTVDLRQFAAEESVTPIVSYSDPEIKQDGYVLWTAAIDLSDFGFPPGATINEIFIRGRVNEGGSGLDLAVVGNLNPLPRRSDIKKATAMVGLDPAVAVEGSVSVP